jgi:hypothetical protein
MQSMTPLLLWRFEETNRDRVAPVRARLIAFCGQRALHARFLNMLSLLEHIGSRKIMTSPAMSAPGLDGLKHLAEEARHAFFFKRAAERIALHTLDYGDESTLAGPSARLYMGRLDVEISRTVEGGAPALPYLYMSMIVELRAVWLYRIYQTVLMEQNAGLTLKSILAEEELHLQAMSTNLRELDRDAESRIAHFSAFEDGRFDSLWSVIEEECAAPRRGIEPHGHSPHPHCCRGDPFDRRTGLAGSDAARPWTSSRRHRHRTAEFSILLPAGHVSCD